MAGASASRPSQLARPAVCRAVTLAIASTLSAGCIYGSRPSASVSDPTLYTSAGLREAEAIAQTTVAADLHRYFSTKPADYEGAATRLDQMIDATQRTHAVAQATEVLTSIDLAATLTAAPVQVPASAAATDATSSATGSGNGAVAGSGTTAGAPVVDAGAESDPVVAEPAKPTDPAPQRPAAASAQALQDFVKVFEDVSLADSTSDRIARAIDIYNAFILAHLRTIPDARLATPEGNRATPDELAGAMRQIACLFPVHVHPGSRPDHMTGVRLRVVDATGANGTDPRRLVERIAVQQLHPTRTYDLEQARFGESVAELAVIKAAVSGKVQNVDLALRYVSEVQQRAEARRRFLTRIGKVGSYADAGQRLFGWNFYPSNLTIRRTSFGERLFTRAPLFRVSSNLEGGSYECMAHLLVPAEVTSITLESFYVFAAIDPDDRTKNDVERVAGLRGTDEERGSTPGKRVARGRIVVDLPPFRVLETAKSNAAAQSSEDFIKMQAQLRDAAPRKVD